jgi:hypothetical protein
MGRLWVTICLRISIMNIKVFWDIALCSLVDVDQHFRGAYFLHHQVDRNIHTRRKNLKFHLGFRLNLELEVYIESCVIC